MSLIERDALIEALKRQDTFPANDRPRFAECIRLALADQGFEVVPASQLRGAVDALWAIIDSDGDPQALKDIAREAVSGVDPSTTRGR